MKNFVLTFMAVAFASTILAQADVTSAYNANKSGDFVKAAEYIEKALTNSKAVAKEKTWRYRGTIYLNIAQSEELKGLYPDALTTSFESLKKALEIKPTGGYSEECKVMMNLVKVEANNAGFTMFTDENFLNAAAKYSLSNDIRAYIEGIADTVAIWSAALCFERAGDWEKAVKGYRTCADMGFKEPKALLSIANLQEVNEDADAALETLEIALAKFPSDQNLLIQQLNIYLRSGRFEEAESNLKKAAENEPDNEKLWYSLGFVYDNLSRIDEAEAAYKAALERNPDYFDANFNIGALYFNKAVAMNKNANLIPQNQH